MNDPNKKPEEPQRTSQPMQPQPTQPMEAPGQGGSEYERDVPHPTGGNQPIAKMGEKKDATGGEAIARTGKSGEGSYEGTKQYDEGLASFSKEHSPDASLDDAKKIDVNDPSLKKAEEAGKKPAMSRPKMQPDEGRASQPSRH